MQLTIMVAVIAVVAVALYALATRRSPMSATRRVGTAAAIGIGLIVLAILSFTVFTLFFFDA